MIQVTINKPEQDVSDNKIHTCLFDFINTIKTDSALNVIKRVKNGITTLNGRVTNGTCRSSLTYTAQFKIHCSKDLLFIIYSASNEVISNYIRKNVHDVDNGIIIRDVNSTINSDITKAFLELEKGGKDKKGGSLSQLFTGTTTFWKIVHGVVATVGLCSPVFLLVPAYIGAVVAKRAYQYNDFSNTLIDQFNNALKPYYDTLQITEVDGKAYTGYMFEILNIIDEFLDIKDFNPYKPVIYNDQKNKVSTYISSLIQTNDVNSLKTYMMHVQSKVKENITLDKGMIGSFIAKTRNTLNHLNEIKVYSLVFLHLHVFDQFITLLKGQMAQPRSSNGGQPDMQIYKTIIFGQMQQILLLKLCNDFFDEEDDYDDIVQYFKNIGTFTNVYEMQIMLNFVFKSFSHASYKPVVDVKGLTTPLFVHFFDITSFLNWARHQNGAKESYTYTNLQSSDTIGNFLHNVLFAPNNLGTNVGRMTGDLGIGQQVTGLTMLVDFVMSPIVQDTMATVFSGLFEGIGAFLEAVSNGGATSNIHRLHMKYKAM